MSEDWFTSLADSEDKGKADYNAYVARRKIEAAMQGGQSAAESKLAERFGGDPGNG